MTKSNDDDDPLRDLAEAIEQRGYLKLLCSDCGTPFLAIQLRIGEDPDTGWCKRCRSYTKRKAS